MPPSRQRPRALQGPRPAPAGRGNVRSGPRLWALPQPVAASPHRGESDCASARLPKGPQRPLRRYRRLACAHSVSPRAAVAHLAGSPPPPAGCVGLDRARGEASRRARGERNWAAARSARRVRRTGRAAPATQRRPTAHFFSPPHDSTGPRRPARPPPAATTRRQDTIHLTASRSRARARARLVPTPTPTRADRASPPRPGNPGTGPPGPPPKATRLSARERAARPRAGSPGQPRRAASRARRRPTRAPLAARGTAPLSGWLASAADPRGGSWDRGRPSAGSTDRPTRRCKRPGTSSRCRGQTGWAGAEPRRIARETGISRQQARRGRPASPRATARGRSRRALPNASRPRQPPAAVERALGGTGAGHAALAVRGSAAADGLCALARHGRPVSLSAALSRPQSPSVAQPEAPAQLREQPRALLRIGDHHVEHDASRVALADRADARALALDAPLA